MAHCAKLLNYSTDLLGFALVMKADRGSVFTLAASPSHYALRVTTVLIPIASRISWSRAIATV